jgi:hypothetical protein
MEAYNHAEYMEAIATNLKEIAHSANHKAFAEASTINMFDEIYADYVLDCFESMERCDFSFIPGHGIFYSPFFPQLAAIPSR